MIKDEIIRKYLNLHPDTPIDRQEYAVSLFTIKQMLAVIEANEREECAKMIENYSQEYWNFLTQRYAAICIRNRGK